MDSNVGDIVNPDPGDDDTPTNPGTPIEEPDDNPDTGLE